MPDLAVVVAAELSLVRAAVERTLALFAGGATVPFIARYRKEATGGLDEVQIGQIQERHEYHVQLEARRTTILDSIAAQGKLSDDLRARILATRSKTELEDLYLPYKPKRRTKATIARERGLEPLADLVWAQAMRLAQPREVLARPFVDAAKGASDLEAALVDSWRRLLEPSVEADARGMLQERADAEAIRVFAENLRHLLLQPPLGGKRVLAIDPGFRTGCKVVALDEQGDLVEETVIYPHEPQKRAAEAKQALAALAGLHRIEAVAVGNGTAGRETHELVRAMKREKLLAEACAVVLVNESGASVYSASEIAREEFPDKDVTVRGAASIGRRLQDPLAELVKIDPKSIGVGQYQHDVNQPALKRSLDAVVASCVNNVGVDVNTASAKLLSYVSGIGDTIARNIVSFRAEHGALRSRRDLLKVP